MAEERYEDSINYYNQWRELSEEEDDTVFLGLANSYYSLERYSEAIPHLISHMEMIADQGEEIDRNKWSLLNVLYIEQEDYANSLEVSKNMVYLFDDPADWRNLSAIYSMLDQDDDRISSLQLRHARDSMEEEAEFLNLSQSLAGEEAPYSGAQILQAAMEDGIVEENEDNLSILVQMYQLSNDFRHGCRASHKTG